MTDEERANVKGVLWLACPINPSDSADIIKNDLRPFIATFIPFVDNFGSSFSIEEYVGHFFDVGFPLSKASEPFNAKDEKDSIPARNQAFFKTGIPFRCLLEDKPTYMALVGRSYWTVTHKAGTL